MAAIRKRPEERFHLCLAMPAPAPGSASHDRHRSRRSHQPESEAYLDRSRLTHLDYLRVGGVLPGNKFLESCGHNCVPTVIGSNLVARLLFSEQARNCCDVGW